MLNFTKFKKIDKKDLYDITLKSAKAKSKEVFIYELGDMSDLFSQKKAEKLRQEFLKNKIKVKQITNKSTLEKFSENDQFINEVMTFRYVPKDIFDIKNEILIFDDIVAVYNSREMFILQDKNFAKNQKQLFQSIWEQGQSPAIGFDYKPNHSFYKNLNYFIENLQIIVWPDVDAKKVYKDFSKKELGEYIKEIISKDRYYDDASYIIIFIWAYEGKKMMDVWKFNDNHVDDRSGPLGDVRVYKDGVVCEDLGLASGNTLLVLGHEEKLRRQSKDLQSYLDGPVPKLPLEIVNGLDFFEE